MPGFSPHRRYIGASEFARENLVIRISRPPFRADALQFDGAVTKSESIAVTGKVDFADDVWGAL